MTFTLPRADLLHGLLWLRDISRGTGDGIVQISAEGDSLAIKATNYSQSAEVTLPLTAPLSGSWVLGLIPVSAFLRSVSSKTVTFSQASTSRLRISAEGTVATFPMTDALNYPEISFPKELPPFPLEPLEEVLAATVFGAADASERPAWAGVRLSAKDGKLHAMSLDGRRLCSCTADVPQETALPEIMVPTPLLDMLPTGKAFSLGMWQKQLVVRADGRTLASPLIDGPPPPFGTLLENFRPTTTWAFRLSDFETVLRPILATSKERILRLSTPRGKLLLEAKGVHTVEAEIPVSAEGPPQTLALSIDGLRSIVALGDIEACLRIQDPYTPVQLCLPEKNSQYVLMPLRL